MVQACVYGPEMQDSHISFDHLLFAGLSMWLSILEHDFAGLSTPDEEVLRYEGDPDHSG